MNLFRTFFAIAAAGAVSLGAADLSKALDAKRWSVFEATAATENGALTVNMPIDYKQGQNPKYLVGWPRLYLLKLQNQEKDWSKAKAVSFDIKLEFTGATKTCFINFHVFCKNPAGGKELTWATPLVPELKNNAVNKIVLPLDKVKNLAGVTGFGFSISESRYKHGENLKFTISDLKLLEK